VITNPNGLLAGVVGKGKSCLAKSLATRSIAFGRRVYVPGDPRASGPSLPRPSAAPRSSSAAAPTGLTHSTQVPARRRSRTRCGPLW
jgi:hypothetical protein